MASDPLRHLRYHLVPITPRPGVAGWEVRDRDGTPSFWVVCEQRDGDAGWVWVHDLDEFDGDDMTLAEVVDQVGPVIGREAVALSAQALDASRRRAADGVAIARLADDLARGEIGLALRLREVRDAHLRASHRVMTQVQRVGAVSAPRDDGSPPFAYLADVVVRESPGRWKIFRDEDDEDPMLMRLWTRPEPGDLGGWKTSHASREGISNRWRPYTVADACRAVGPAHAGEVLSASVAACAAMDQSVADGVMAQVESARPEIGAWLLHIARCHIEAAQEIEAISVALATPGMHHRAP